MSETHDDARYEREASFHDHRYSHDSRAGAAKFYSITERARQYYSDACFRRGTDIHALEYGCGPGGIGFALAEAGAQVTGIDISAVAIEQAKEETLERGLTIDFHEMNAEDLSFEDEAFDLVCGSGILHHLDIDQGCREVARVLRPDGFAVFTEPLGHNPLINWYRNRTPEMRSDDEHPILRSDLATFERYFGSVRTAFFDLSSLALVPARNASFFDGGLRAAHRLDAAMFRLPGLKWWAWNVVIEVAEPRAT